MRITDKQYVEYVKGKLDEYKQNGKLTIAYFIDSYYPIVDGVVNVLNSYCEHLKDKFNVIVCTPSHKKCQEDKDYLIISCRSVYCRLLNYDLSLAKNDSQFAQLLDYAKIDLVHLHSPYMLGKWGLRYAKKRNIPVIATFHSLYRKDYMSMTHLDCISNLLVKYIMKTFNNVDCVYTMHEKIAEELKSYGFVGGNDKIRYISNATDDEYIGDDSATTELVNTKYDLTNKSNIMLFVGRIVKVKKVFFISRVCQLLKQRNFDFTMIYVGNGPDENKLKHQIKEMGLSDNVIFTEKISDREELKAIYKRSNLFFFPSTYDTSSLVQIEAATQKTAGLFRNNSVTAYTIEEGVSGFLSSASVEETADKIMSIFSDSAKLQEVSQSAYDRLHVTWGDLTNTIEEEYTRYLTAERLAQIREKETFAQKLKKKKEERKEKSDKV
ncbi:MAG: glycosyltransferase [Clostridia bacterium]